MNKLKQVLTFLRIIDTHDGLISITNVAVIVVLAKLAIAPAVSITEVGGLLIALASYQSKKIINKDAGKEESVVTPEEIQLITSKLEEVTSQVSAISISNGIKKLGGN